MLEAVACRIAAWFATPLAICGQLLACLLWLLFGGNVDKLTLCLSIEAITITQLVLVAQSRGERKTKEAMRELVHAIPEADDNVVEDL